jgi:hypothetical protein
VVREGKRKADVPMPRRATERTVRGRGRGVDDIWDNLCWGLEMGLD